MKRLHSYLTIIVSFSFIVYSLFYSFNYISIYYFECPLLYFFTYLRYACLFDFVLTVHVCRGEELFALPLTDYPELMQTQKEVKLADQLFTLYVDVLGTLNDWKSVLWADVTKQIGAILKCNNALEYMIMYSIVR